MPAVRTPFIVSKHGFHFRNRFEFPFFSQFNLFLVGPIPLGNIIYGLCGGMCFTAMDYFKINKPVPDYDKPENIDLHLFNRLWNRQIDSFQAGTVQKVFQWMLQDDKDISTWTVKQELPKLKASIDQGQPVVLALIRVKGLMGITKNHQVMAVGYESDTASNLEKIFLYEPNYPGQEPLLIVNMTRTKKGYKLTQSTGEALRGFFVIEYQLEPI